MGKKKLKLDPFGLGLIATANQETVVKKRGTFAKYTTFCPKCKSKISFICSWDYKKSMEKWLRRKLWTKER